MVLLEGPAVCDDAQLGVVPRAVALRVLLCSSLWKTVGQPSAPQRAAVPGHELLQRQLTLSMLSAGAREARVTSMYARVILRNPCYSKSMCQ